MSTLKQKKNGKGKAVFKLPPGVVIDQSAFQSKYAGKHDSVNHPKHYNEHPSGVECIEITEHQNFCIGNAMKYLWRADLKNGTEDLKKAAWYINREITRRTKG